MATSTPGSAALLVAAPAPAITPRRSIQYYAIRQCDSLDAPAVFLSWKDCNFYLEDDDTNTGPVEYETFQGMLEAVNYIHEYQVKRPSDEQDKPSPPTNSSKPISPTRKHHQLPDAKASSTIRRDVAASATSKTSSTNSPRQIIVGVGGRNSLAGVSAAAHAHQATHTKPSLPSWKSTETYLVPRKLLPIQKWIVSGLCDDGPRVCERKIYFGVPPVPHNSRHTVRIATITGKQQDAWHERDNNYEPQCCHEDKIE
jgi:hypothetical protein